MAYRTGEALKEKPTPISCNSVIKLRKRVRQLLRDKAQQPNSRGIVRKWTDRKADILAKLEQRLREKGDRKSTRLNSSHAQL
jgi:hypothetical protein